MFNNDNNNSLDQRPNWSVIDGTPLRDLVGEDVGGDIHHTVDANPESPTFGDVHWTVQLPGGRDLHGS